MGVWPAESMDGMVHGVVAGSMDGWTGRGKEGWVTGRTDKHISFIPRY